MRWSVMNKIQRDDRQMERLKKITQNVVLYFKM